MLGDIWKRKNLLAAKLLAPPWLTNLFPKLQIIVIFLLKFSSKATLVQETDESSKCFLKIVISLISLMWHRSWNTTGWQTSIPHLYDGDIIYAGNWKHLREKKNPSSYLYAWKFNKNMLRALTVVFNSDCMKIIHSGFNINLCPGPLPDLIRTTIRSISIREWDPAISIFLPPT